VRQDLSDDLLAYLRAWHATTVSRKLAAGHRVDLPFAHFLDLFEERQLASLQSAVEEDRLNGLQDRDNPYAYVATWRSYAARSSGIYDKTTAFICSRMKSDAINKPKPGDVLREDHRAAISKTLTGMPKSDDHKAALSEALKGTTKQPWSAERKAERRRQNAERRSKRS
jgi:hypothetical protein